MRHNRLLQILLMVLFFLPVAFESYAQTAILNMTSTRIGSDIDMSTVATAGSYVSLVTDQTQTLRYKYLDYTWNDYARIDVAITSGTIPNGMRITMYAPGYSNYSRGYAVSNGTITLSNNPGIDGGLLLYDIYNINDSYTITSLVTMKIYNDTFADLRPAITPMTLTYTITIYLY